MLHTDIINLHNGCYCSSRFNVRREVLCQSKRAEIQVSYKTHSRAATVKTSAQTEASTLFTLIKQLQQVAVDVTVLSGMNSCLRKYFHSFTWSPQRPVRLPETVTVMFTLSNQLVSPPSVYFVIYLHSFFIAG